MMPNPINVLDPLTWLLAPDGQEGAPRQEVRGDLPAWQELPAQGDTPEPRDEARNSSLPSLRAPRETETHRLDWDED